MMRLSTATIALLAVGGIVSQAAPRAQAAIISGTYTISGSDFVSQQAPPDSSISEVVSISFDNSADITAQTTGISLVSGTIIPSSPLAFSYLQSIDTLVIGGTAATVATADPLSTDFAATLNQVSTSPGLVSLSYSTGTETSFAATTSSVSFAPSVATPEPASLVLVGGGLAGLLLTGRRRRAG